MKKELHIGIACLIICFNISAQYVTIEGRQFKDENGNDFYPIVCNYQVFPVSTDSADFSSTHISPHSMMGESNGWECECGQSLQCSEQLAKDLKYILSMGFNAIRVMGLDADFYNNGDTLIWLPDRRKVAPEDDFYVYTPNCIDDKRKWFQLDGPDYTGGNPPNNTDIFFQRIKEFLTVVSQTEYNGKKLKVVLLTGRNLGKPNTTFPSLYTSYLKSLGNFINSDTTGIKQTLLAYDLYNEPGDRSLGFSKQEVCENSRRWYDTLKYYDPNHLITMGGGGAFDVIYNADPGVLSLDFYSVHTYPALRQYEYDSGNYLSSELDRIKGGFYWLQKYLSMPWMIGEIGFTTQSIKDQNPPPIPWANKDSVCGTLSDLKIFIDSTLYDTWQCSGSGYSWWDYQGIGNKFGMLYEGRTINAPPPNCDPPPYCCHDSNDVKEAHKIIESFTPSIGTCLPPVQYYDPFNHYTYSINPHNITGTVTDKNNPLHPGIEGVYLKAWTRLYDTTISNVTKGVFNEHYTFTKEDGSYTIIPYDYNPRIPNYNKIEQIILSTAGASVAQVSKWLPDSVMNPIQNFQLEKYSFKYNDVIAHLIINPPGKTIFQAWNSLSVYDISIEPLGEAEFKARREISVNTPFHSKPNSNTWIHTVNTWSDCSFLNFSDLAQFKSSNDLTSRSEFISKEIEIDFNPMKNKIKVYPNPTEGVVNIKIEEMMIDDNYNIFLIDQYGRFLINFTQNKDSFQLDLSGLSKGIYLLLITSPKCIFNTKIVHI